VRQDLIDFSIIDCLVILTIQTFLLASLCHKHNKKLIPLKKWQKNYFFIKGIW